VRSAAASSPTAMLPRNEVSVLFDAIRRVRQRGVGVIYVSHRLDEIFTIADRVTVLRDRRRVGTFRVDKLDQDGLVELMTGGESLAVRGTARADRRADGLLAVEGLHGTVLSDVSLQAHGGELLGVAGLTGSGREELLPLLFGAEQRGRGDVRVAGAQLAAGRPSAAISAGMAFVPRDRHTTDSVPSLSVRETWSSPTWPHTRRVSRRCGAGPSGRRAVGGSRRSTSARASRTPRS